MLYNRLSTGWSLILLLGSEWGRFFVAKSSILVSHALFLAYCCFCAWCLQCCCCCCCCFSLTLVMPGEHNSYSEHVLPDRHFRSTDTEIPGADLRNPSECPPLQRENTLCSCAESIGVAQDSSAKRSVVLRAVTSFLAVRDGCQVSSLEVTPAGMGSSPWVVLPGVLLVQPCRS